KETTSLPRITREAKGAPKLPRITRKAKEPPSLPRITKETTILPIIPKEPIALPRNKPRTTNDNLGENDYNHFNQTWQGISFPKY
ncbi:unnamed protein product, partial [Brachionus calyciflorus]